jgi:dipeptidyl aminopeptidase/acylaminoacyl peptidase
MQKHLGVCLLAIAMIVGCNPPCAQNSQGANQNQALKDARQGFQTKITRRDSASNPVSKPPAGVFQLVRYTAAPGQLAAYLTPDPKDGKKHPAIIWITGGDCNSIDEIWNDAPKENDQTAAAYRKAGIIMMFPSLRGGNDNPGAKEGFLGEVDDVIDAANFLAKQSYVDPNRIYLGGHSTGGTLVLLVSECSDRFRAVISFGPVSDVRGYGPQYNPFDLSNDREVELRSPGHWLASIKSPTFVLEGAGPDSNIGELQVLKGLCTNAQVHFLPVRGASHFSVLAPTNQLVAKKILADDGPKCNLAFTEEELAKSFSK